MLTTTLRLVCGVSLVAAMPLAMAASADAWPSKPVRMVVPFPAAGAADATARVVGDRLRTELGQPVVIENRSGAAGNIGAEHAAKAAPDGYTMLMANSTLVTNISLYKNLPYDFVRDFIPVSRIAFVPNVVVVSPQHLKINTLPEFIKYVKESKGKQRVLYGSGGSGTSLHLSASLFSNMLGVDMEHVPYKGGAAAATALLGGEVHVVFAPLAEVSSQIDGGRMRPLAVTTLKRSPRLPDVPALSEFLPGFDVALWTGILVPAGTPNEVVNRLNAAILSALNHPELKQRLAEQGAEPAGTSPAEFKQFIASEVDKWRKLVKISGAQVQ